MQLRARRFFAKNWRPILNIVTISAMVLLVYALRNQILETLQNVQNVQWWALLLMLPLQIVNYDSYTRMYGSILRHLRQPVTYRQLFRVQLELNFVNNAFPSGGISGISFFGLRLRKHDVRPGTATLIQLVKFISIFISLQLLIGIGLLALAIGGKANNLVLLFAAILATMTLIGTFLMGFVVGDKRRIRGTFRIVTQLLNRIIHLVRPNHPETIRIAALVDFANEIHDNFQQLRSQPKLLLQVLGRALIANVTEILTLYMVYIAFGEWVNIGAVIIAYAIANFAGLVSVLPGGVGIYEVLMTAALTAGGVPAALSIPVVIMYRVLSMAIQLIPGSVLYHTSLSDGQTK